MCGIGGVLRFRPSGDAAELVRPVELLNRLQAHRGPDDEGIWSDNQYCALAHRRLSIIDLSRRGRQPMLDSGGRYVITFNGEIYNYRRLRATLEAAGCRFRTDTDTEVLLEGYTRRGTSFLEELDGMFAMAIYDRHERTLLLARDRVGEKPLYYALTAGAITFASELRALAAVVGDPPSLDAYGVCQYLLLRYVPAPTTILRGIGQIEAGCWLRTRADGRTEGHRYFAFDRTVDAPKSDPIEVAEAVEDALADAIHDRLTAADVPVGAFLSSGVDSSLVCAIAAIRLGRPVKTYCAGFASGESETAQARRIAEHLGLEHETYTLTNVDLLEIASSFGKFMDEPNGDRSCVPVYALSKQLRKDVKVALSGDGGDELFCGYGRYAEFQRREQQSRAATSPVDALERYFSDGLPVFAMDAVKRAFPDEHRRWRQDFLDRYAPAMMRAGWNPSQRLSVVDALTYLPGAVLAKVDRMSMRHALEVRSPFFAPSVLSHGAGLPSELCFRGGELKPLLRALLAKYLPHELLSQAKIGFGMPSGFMRSNAAVFDRLFAAARETLAGSSFFGARRMALEILTQSARQNINSYWAFIALGLWVEASGIRL